jgi:hypothetical protein
VRAAISWTPARFCAEPTLTLTVSGSSLRCQPRCLVAAGTRKKGDPFGVKSSATAASPTKASARRARIPRRAAPDAIPWDIRQAQPRVRGQLHPRRRLRAVWPV